MPLAITGSCARDVALQHFRASLPLGIVDWLRPLLLALPEYAQKWPQLAKEAKAALPSQKQLKPEEVKVAVEQAHWHVVSLKGLEIVAASVLKEPLLLHAKGPSSPLSSLPSPS